MKRAVFVFGLLPLAALTKEPNYLDTIESPVFEATGTAQEIAKRAMLCIPRIVRNDEVTIKDTATTLLGPVAPPEKSRGVGGGQVIVSSDIESATIVANSRVDFPGTMGLGRNARSTITFQAKDGRFRITHSAIETLQKDSGITTNVGYTKQGKGWGSGWEKAQTALEGVSAKIADCVSKPAASTDW
jgi:hypothetical protein